VLALLVARLDSKLLGLPSTLIRATARILVLTLSVTTLGPVLVTAEPPSTPKFPAVPSATFWAYAGLAAAATNPKMTNARELNSNIGPPGSGMLV